MSSDKNGPNGKLAWPTVQRLTEYLIILEQYLENNTEVISSSELAEIYSNTPSQVRQDIFRLPNTGRVGQGYKIEELTEAIRKVLGINNKSRVAIIGCGKMGTALAQHIPFESYGMELTALFDKDPNVVGSEIDGLPVQNVTELETVLPVKKVKIAGLCVPSDAAQEVTDRLVNAGIKGILNFTRKRLKVPKRVIVQYRQPVCAFIQLAHNIRNPN